MLIDQGKGIVGTSGMSFAEKPPYFICPSGKLGILSSMYTDPDYRRLGIATELLDRVVKEGKSMTMLELFKTKSR
ncbi:MAG: GNAT family N-acetyltransferase [Lachnospiraceae bacterium]|nr:GNAT family N-acetyltransferase [Lachnospiraceae bacterium]